jgi:hypothetical protein
MSTKPATLNKDVLAEHLIPLPGGQWAVWRCVGLRSAGFPVTDALKLEASREALITADVLLHVQEAADRAREDVLRDVRSELDELRRSGKWENKIHRVALLKALGKLKAGKLPSLPASIPEPKSVADLRKALHDIEDHRKLFDQEFRASVAQCTKTLREVARCPRFREAITWQNRQAVHTALDPLLRNADEPRMSQQRQHEELIASYLQRYSTKNETIGFFGPVGWARFVEQDETLSAKPSENLLATRTVYFEAWAIEELAAAILQDHSVYPWLIPLPMPFIRMEGSTLHHPAYGAVKLPPASAAVMNACNGRSSAIEIATKVIPSAPSLSGPAQVYDVLKKLAAQGLIHWSFSIPLNSRAEQSLRAAILKIGNPQTRDKAIRVLDELECARDAVVSAVGDGTKLDVALQHLEQTFTRLTKKPSTRGLGQSYIGRTVVYEDCRRDGEVLLGTDLLRAASAPLSLLLTCARWLTSKFAEIYQDEFEKVYSELAKASGDRRVEAASFFLRVPEILRRGEERVGSLRKQLQEKWALILNLDASRCESENWLRYSAEGLRAQVQREFPSQRSGWNTARYTSPDLMIVASSQEAVQRGDYMLVMGELHVAGNTLSSALFVNQHPTPDDLLQAVEHDLEGSNVVPVVPKDAMHLMARLCPVLVPRTNFYLEYTRNSFIEDRSRALPISSLVIDPCGGSLKARTRDGKMEFNLIDLLSTALMRFVVRGFQPFEARQHTPRISIDQLVIHRESWRFLASEIPFTQDRDPAGRFFQIRKWARNQGLPRFVFFKTPIEAKPCYLDFDSPILVDLFAKLVRRTLDANDPMLWIDVSEMLPKPDQVWLADSQGRRYTSELRMVALDLTQ